jgi:hypothetical protein
MQTIQQRCLYRKMKGITLKNPSIPRLVVHMLLLDKVTATTPTCHHGTQEQTVSNLIAHANVHVPHRDP